MQEKTTQDRIYFPNLNGLRAIGAGIVMIDHVEFLKVFWGLPTSSWFPFSGKIGVTLFFALSGFLITSLLFTERKNTGTIQLKKFYIRRVLRILPLYYLIILLSILVFSQISFLQIPGYTDRMFRDISLSNILIMLFLIPNINNFYIPFADQRWSIIVEEQFYLVQPFLVKFVQHIKTLTVVFIAIIFSPEIVQGLAYIFGGDQLASKKFIVALATQLKYLACIAVGCLFSIIFFKRESLLKTFFFQRATQWGVLALIIGLITVGHYAYGLSAMVDLRVFSFLFAVIVLNATQNSRNIFRLEKPSLNFLGKISYGIYMYHPVCIGCAIALAAAIPAGPVVQNAIIYGLSIAMTITIAWLSYNYFEQFFLKLKPHAKLPGGLRKKKAEPVSAVVVEKVVG